MIAIKCFFLCALLAGIAAKDAAQDVPKGPKPAAVEILSEKSLVREDGYNFEFQTSDGVSRQEEAQLITVGDKQGIAVKGSYSYEGSDGLQYTVTFTADDKGFKPVIQATKSNAQQ